MNENFMKPVPAIFLPNAPSGSRLDLASETQQAWNNIYLPLLIGIPLSAFAALIYRLKPTANHA
jgi:hypothetical protein